MMHGHLDLAFLSKHWSFCQVRSSSIMACITSAACSWTSSEVSTAFLVCVWYILNTACSPCCGGRGRSGRHFHMSVANSNATKFPKSSDSISGSRNCNTWKHSCIVWLLKLCSVSKTCETYDHSGHRSVSNTSGPVLVVVERKLFTKFGGCVGDVSDSIATKSLGEQLGSFFGRFNAKHHLEFFPSHKVRIISFTCALCDGAERTANTHGSASILCCCIATTAVWHNIIFRWLDQKLIFLSHLKKLNEPWNRLLSKTRECWSQTRT